MRRITRCMVVGVFLIVAVTVVAVTAGQALEQKPILTLEMAKKVADTCEALQQKEGWRPVNIAIFDDGGNLKLFRRQEKAFVGSIQLAQMKGHTSAMFPSPTRRFGALAFGDKEKPATVPGIAFVPGLASLPGGLPIVTAAGDPIGSIGVSGATGDQDEMCAQAGLDAIAEMLK